MAASNTPDELKLRPRELFFLMVGSTGAAGGAVIWFRVAPMLMAKKGVGLADLSAMGRFVLNGGFGPAALIATAILLAGGYATRTTLGKDRATWILAAGASVAVAALLLTVSAIGDPLFAGPPSADPDGP